MIITNKLNYFENIFLYYSFFSLRIALKLWKSVEKIIWKINEKIFENYVNCKKCISQFGKLEKNLSKFKR